MSAQAPLQEPEVLLPGVPEAVAVGSRWQPLFRDPTFGGSMEPKAGPWRGGDLGLPVLFMTWLFFIGR